MAMPEDYRTRIYENYATNFQDAEARFNTAKSRQWGKAYAYYFRHWLPAASNAEIVDLGCGSGRLLHFFQERGYTHLQGVDISQAQISLAKQVSTNVAQADVLEFLEGARGRFDLITALDLVEHFRKPEVLRFLDGCFRALKPGGRLILQTPNAESALGTAYRYDDFTHEIGFTSNSLMRLLALVGFSATEPREAGPIPCGYSVSSSVRYLLWQSIRAGLLAWNIVETGNKGSGIVTRVFLCAATKPT
jgi:2-polyprenyl-3-methyl-5-hydroxy-6-metoxy-1,4-benzoquinol methylase